MSAQTITQPIRATETGLLRTEVHATVAGFEWQHSLGPQIQLPFVTFNPQIQLTGALVQGAGGPASRSYLVPGDSLVADLLTNASLPFSEIGSCWGEALKALHRQERCDDMFDFLPRTMRRADAWLSGSWQPVLAVIGAHGLAKVRGWADEMSQGLQLCHGQPGIAHWVLTSEGQEGRLLVGEDIGIADERFDLAWVLGEFAEIFAFYPSCRGALQQLRAGFLENYEKYSSDELRVGIAYRLIQHAYDWHHYAGASEKDARTLLSLANAYL